MTIIIDAIDHKKISEMRISLFTLELAIASSIEMFDINICLVVAWDPRPAIRKILDTNDQIIEKVNKVIEIQYKYPSLNDCDVKMLEDFKVIMGTIRGITHENRPINDLIEPVDGLKKIIKTIKKHFYEKFV